MNLKLQSSGNVTIGRKIVGKIVDEPTANYRIAVRPMLRVPNDGNRVIDGARWHWRMLPKAKTATGALAAIRTAIVALKSPEPMKVAPVTDRIVVMGCGLSRRKIDELAAAIRNRL